MAAPEADAERGLAFLPLEVRCSRGAGTLQMTLGGDLIFNPHPRRGGFLRWIANLFRPVRHQQIPAQQLLGARLESPCAFTVWFAPECSTKMGCVEKRRFNARSTRRFETPDTQAAAALVHHLRRASSWWGRQQPPHVAAIVNPVSGRGSAVRLFETRVLPLLRDVAGLRVTVHVTQARMHAAELVRELRLNTAGGPTAGTGGPTAGTGGAEGAERPGFGARQQQDGQAGADLIMFVGGDGTLYEGLQGLFQRPDWDVARRIPLAAIPCGSGNGLAASTGLWDPTTAAVAVCRGRVEPVDVASVLQPPGNRFYCLLSVVYGAMANLDIGTNHLRWMGEMRFHLGGLWEIIRGRCYSCRIFVLPPEDPQVAVGSEAGGHVPCQTRRSAHADGPVSSALVDVGLTPLRSAAGAGSGGGALPAASTPSGAAAGAAADAGGGGGGGGGMEELLLPVGGSAGASTSGGRAGNGAGSRLSDYPAGPPLPLLSQLPSLPHPLPNTTATLPGGWVQLGDSFAILGVYNTQYLALGARSNPGGCMGDGAWEVWHVEPDAPAGSAPCRRAGGSVRLRCLKVLLGVEDGSFAKTPGVMAVTKARALMFEQRDSATWTVLDGEEVPDLPLFLEVHPALCSMLVSPQFEEKGL